MRDGRAKVLAASVARALLQQLVGVLHRLVVPQLLPCGHFEYNSNSNSNKYWLQQTKPAGFVPICKDFHTHPSTAVVLPPKGSLLCTISMKALPHPLSLCVSQLIAVRRQDFRQPRKYHTNTPSSWKKKKVPRRRGPRTSGPCGKNGPRAWRGARRWLPKPPSKSRTTPRGDSSLRSQCTANSVGWGRGGGGIASFIVFAISGDICAAGFLIIHTPIVTPQPQTHFIAGVTR